MKLYTMGFVIGFRNRKVIGVPDCAEKFVRIGSAVILLVSLMAFVPVNAVAQTGTVSGKVTDAQTGVPLPFAKVAVEATGQKVTTDRDGQYILRSVPGGNQTISVHYLGYSSDQITISVEPGERVNQPVELQEDFIEGDRMFVTSAQRNRARALNKQLRASSPLSINTSDQMDRFADYSVQDAIVRIAGVQAGGQGEISLRGSGLGRFNVTVDGQQVATTGISDRSVDLGIFATDLFQDVEVIKVLTPDMHADAVGGVVNLVTYHPLGGERHVDVRLGGGANTQYLGMTGPDSRASVRYSETMTDDLAISLNLNYQQVNRSWERLGITYDVADFDDVSTDVIERFSPSLHNDSRTMVGSLLQLTWQPTDESVFHVRGMINHDDREINLHRSSWIANNNWVDPSIEVVGGRFNYDFGRQEIATTQYSFQAGGRHLMNAFNLEYHLGWARSNVDAMNLLMPFQSGAIDYSINMADRNRPDISLINSDLPVSRLMTMQTVESLAELNVDNIFSGRVDAEIPLGPLSFKVGSSANLMVKDVNDLGAVYDFHITYRGFLRLNEFEKNWEGTDVFDRYDIPWLAEGEEVTRFYNVNSHIMARNWDRFREVSEYRNYKVTEDIYAGYGMATVELGNVTLLGGARLEYTDSENFGRMIEFDRFGRYYATSDTVRSHSRSDLFPNAQVIFTPQQNTRILMAYSKSMNRPDYLMLTPFGIVNRQDSTLFRGNPALDPMISNNFDLYLDYNFLDMGAISLGLYYKDMSNFFYLRQQRVDIREGDFVGLDPMFDGNQESIPIHETVFRNGDETASMYGVELSWQQNLAFLPGVLSNLGAYANYSWSNSVYESDREDDVALPYQSPHVVNTALDYSIGRLFTRVSYHWTADMISSLGNGTTLAPSVSRTEQVYLDQYQYGWSDLSVTVRFRISENFRFWADAFNLLPDNDQVMYLHTRDLYPTTIDYRRGRGIKMGIRFDL